MFRKKENLIREKTVHTNTDTQENILKLTDSVVSPGVVVSSILLSTHQLLRMEQLSVGPGSNLVHHRWLKIDENSP
jgi:hypothetical protein